jgi:hypothetical protein
MEVLPLANIELHARDFNIVAKIGARSPRAAPAAVKTSVVVLDAPEFHQIVASSHLAASPEEQAGLGKLQSERCYQMPVADHVAGEEGLSWYGESPLLWGLVSSEICCDAVAFIATPAAVAYLQTKHPTPLTAHAHFRSEAKTDSQPFPSHWLRN